MGPRCLIPELPTILSHVGGLEQADPEGMKRPELGESHPRDDVNRRFLHTLSSFDVKTSSLGTGQMWPVVVVHSASNLPPEKRS